MKIFYIYNTDKDDYKNVVENLPEEVNIIYTATADNLRFGEALNKMREKYEWFSTYSNSDLVELLSFLIDYYNILKSSYQISEYDGYEDYEDYNKIVICYGDFVDNFNDIPEDGNIIVVSNKNLERVTKLTDNFGLTNCIVYDKKGILAMLEVIEQVQLPIKEYFCIDSPANLNDKISDGSIVLYA